MSILRRREGGSIPAHAAWCIGLGPQTRKPDSWLRSDYPPWYDMNGNPDPKPGRWILPLIIIAMVGFTYVFVSSLEERIPTETESGLDLPTLDSTSTTTPIIDTTTTTSGPSVRQVYVEEMTGFLDELKQLNTEFQAINTEFEEKAITFSVAVTGMEEKIAEFQAWYTAISASAVPASEADLQLPHQDILDAALDPVEEAEAALEGLRGPSSGPRQEAVVRLAEAVTEFEVKVNAAATIANS